MRNAGLEEAQAGIKIAGRNINSLRYAEDTTLMAESEEELKSPLRDIWLPTHPQFSMQFRMSRDSTKLRAPGIDGL